MKVIFATLLLWSAAAAASPPVCHTPSGCDAGWSAARTWVLEHAGMQLRLVTGDYLVTYEPVNANPYRFAAEVSRVRDAGATRIVGRVWCGAEEIRGQPCSPNSADLLADLERTVQTAVTQEEQ